MIFLHRINFLIMFFALILFLESPFSYGEVLGATTENKSGISKEKIEIKTATAFDQKEIVEYKIIPFGTEYIKDTGMEYNTQKVTREGINGTKTLTYLITHWLDEEIDRILINAKIEEPTTKIIAKGTKIVWRTHKTSDLGKIEYWHKLEIWATKYDANCAGCLDRTYSGTEVKKGVCAVDPTVIQLGTDFYVDGYGLCRAEDIGGGIKGNKIDLGFKDASKASWGAGYTNIYLLTNPPE